MAVEKNTTTRNYSIDVLRILACLAVVMAHVVSPDFVNDSPSITALTDWSSRIVAG